MPELPEVETVRRGLMPVLAGRRLARVDVRRPDLRFPLPEALARRLAGRRIEDIERRAKFLRLRLDSDEVLILHLGMSGRLLVAPAEAPALDRHDHVIFETEEGVQVRFHDPRRFGFIDLVAAADVAAYPAFANLGPEPLGPEFTGAYLSRHLRGREAPLKAAILDQRVVAGMGNIYASESLFRARLSPKRRAGTVTGVRSNRLAEAIRSVLAEAIAAGGATLRDHRQPSGELGYFQHHFAVYGREGESCPQCLTTADRRVVIRRVVQSGRSTFYCARCQR
jgi:formamidopyrimidine-DNA glycosylase